MRDQAKAAGLAFRIKERLGVDARLEPCNRGQFHVRLDGEKVASLEGSWLARLLGRGYPDPDAVVALLSSRAEGA